VPQGRADEARLVADMIELTRQYGRYGYRRVAALLRDAGWHVNDKRVERLWKREGLKVPLKQPKKGLLIFIRFLSLPRQLFFLFL
jgi:putative transposase